MSNRACRLKYAAFARFVMCVLGFIRFECSVKAFSFYFWCLVVKTNIIYEKINVDSNVKILIVLINIAKYFCL